MAKKHILLSLAKIVDPLLPHIIAVILNYLHDVYESCTLFYQVGDLFELGMFSGFEKLKQRHFNRAYIYTSNCHFRKGELLVFQSP